MTGIPLRQTFLLRPFRLQLKPKFMMIQNGSLLARPEDGAVALAVVVPSVGW